MTRRMRRHASLNIPLAFPRVLATAAAPLRKRGLRAAKEWQPASRRRFWLLLVSSVFAFAVVRLLTL